MSYDYLSQLPPEAAQRREVFALFGLAMYHAQCVERQIGILLATTLNPAFFRSTSEERERFFDNEFTKTLGRMLATVRSRVTLSPTFESELEAALERRNWLAHDYFWLRAHDVLSTKGRDKMIEELKEAADYLDTVDRQLTGVSERWMAKLGVDYQSLREKYLREARGEDA